MQYQNFLKSKETMEEKSNKRIPLGQRINNPLNIRFMWGQTWQGQVGSEKGFVVFDNVENGLRAAFKILLSYLGMGVLTPRSIIARWAPETENNVQAYIGYVSNASGIHPDCPVTTDMDLLKVVRAMCYFESNFTPTAEQLLESIKRATCCLSGKYQRMGFEYLTRSKWVAESL